MKDFILRNDPQYLAERMGDLSQIAGVKRYTLAEGKAAGVEAVDVETGGGLCYTVLPGRGMDIARLTYKGVPVSFMSKTRVVGPQYYEPEGFNWMRSFFGGMLTTCGLSNAGIPCEDGTG